MLAEKNVYIGSAYHHLQVISQDEEKRMEYEAREKAILDYNQSVLEAEQRGEARGRAEGETRGEARGEVKGRAAERAESIRIFIADHIEENVPKEKTITKLQKHYHLTETEAEQQYAKYSKFPAKI